MNPIIRGLIAVVLTAMVLVGCSNKINQTGAWLVSTDSTLVPVKFDSRADSAASTSKQVNLGLPTGSSTELLIGKVPWTEADFLIRFAALDPVDSAQAILSATITLSRGSYELVPAGESANNLSFAGYQMDTVWNATTFTWDSVNAVGYGSTNIITSSAVTDSTIVLQVDTGVVRQWAIASQDTNVKNNGMIVKPTTVGGVVSVYGPAYGVTGFVPVCSVIYQKNGTIDTSNVALSYATSVAQTAIETSAPPGPYRFVQAGTGERESLIFDLSRVPKYSVVNKATLTLNADSTAQLNFTRKYIADTLVAFYVSDPTSWQYSTSYPALAPELNSQFTFDVTMLVQHMLTTQNYGFMILQASELNNIDSRFVYDENAPDSLKPRLTIIYTPTSKR